MTKIRSATWSTPKQTPGSAAGHARPGKRDVGRRAPAATRGALQPLLNQRQVELGAVVRDDGIAAVEECGDVALPRRHGVARARLLRAKDVQAAVLALCARHLSYRMVPMTVISCRWREKPVVSMSSSSSSIRRAACTSRLYKRCAGLRGKQAWRGARSSRGAGGQSTPFSSRLPRSIPNARGASRPTNPRASGRRSSDNEGFAKNASHKTSLTAAADMKLRYAAMMYCSSTRAQKYSPGRNWIGSRTMWLANWWWRPCSPRQARPGNPLRTCRPWSIAWISRTASPASHSRPHSAAYNSKDERQGRTGKGKKIQNTSSSKRSSSCRTSRLPRLDARHLPSRTAPALRRSLQTVPEGDGLEAGWHAAATPPRVDPLDHNMTQGRCDPVGGAICFHHPQGVPL